MPAYIIPNRYTTPKYATIGHEVYSFGYDNLNANPQGPAAPTAPTLTANVSATGNLTNAQVFVQTVYVFPGSSPAQVNPATMPMGFGSATSNITLSGSNTAVIVTSPGQSTDVGNIAIGYNVFAGSNANVITLVNTNAIVPIGTNYTIQTTAQLGAPTGGIGYASSPTPTYNSEVLTANTAGLQFAVPISGSNFQGIKCLSWKTTYANGTPSSANIWIQGAYEDNANSYVTLDYSTNTAGELRVINPINAKFIRAYCSNVVSNVSGNLVTSTTIGSTVSFRIE